MRGTGRPTCADARVRKLLLPLRHMAIVAAKLSGPGGVHKSSIGLRNVGSGNRSRTPGPALLAAQDSHGIDATGPHSGYVTGKHSNGD